MPVVPAGSLSTALQAVRTTLSHAASWQTWTGTATPGDAAGRIHYYALPDAANVSGGYEPEELDALRPAIVLTFQTPEWLPRVGFTARWTREAMEQFCDSGSVFAIVNSAVEDGDATPYADVLMDFTNRLGVLVDEALLVGPNVEGACLISSVTLVSEPNRCTQVQRGMEGDFCQAMLKVDWGLRPSHY